MNLQEQLRSESKDWSRAGYGGVAHTLTEAADRIKHLTGQIEVAERVLTESTKTSKDINLHAAIGVLRAALEVR